MKKWICAALAAICMGLAGCQSATPQPAETQPPEAEEQQIVASFYPVYALAYNILSDVPRMTLRCLVQPQDGCLRAYSLSEWDLALLASADAVLLGGRGLESFESALLAGEDGLPVVSLMDGITLLGEGESANEESGHWTGENPWLYLSVDGAKSMCQALALAMTALDPDYAQRYEANYAAYAAKLDALLEQTRKKLAFASGRKVILAHEGLAYFAEQYGLTTAGQLEREPGAWFEGEDLTSALEALEAMDASVILAETQAPQLMIEDLTKAGYTLALIDTLSTRGSHEAASAYEEAMRANAETLARALQTAE